MKVYDTKMKICRICKIEKELTEFHPKTLGGHKPNCKKCQKEIRDNRTDEEKAKVKSVGKKWREDNQDRIKEYKKNNQNRIKELGKIRREKNKEHIKVRRKNYMQKKLEDPVFRLKRKIRSTIKKALNRNGYSKNSRTYEILGCTYEEFIVYLNDNKYGFKYEDGIFDVDHIIAISEAETLEDVLRLSHFTNYQLLPSEYNRYLKIDNKWDRKDFELWLIKNHNQ